jgi:hypothetical protein
LQEGKALALEEFKFKPTYVYADGSPYIQTILKPNSNPKSNSNSKTESNFNSESNSNFKSNSNVSTFSKSDSDSDFESNSNASKIKSNSNVSVSQFHNLGPYDKRRLSFMNKYVADKSDSKIINKSPKGPQLQDPTEQQEQQQTDQLLSFTAKCSSCDRSVSDHPSLYSIEITSFVYHAIDNNCPYRFVK